MLDKEELLELLKFYGAEIKPGKGEVYIKESEQLKELSTEMVYAMFSDFRIDEFIPYISATKYEIKSEFSNKCYHGQIILDAA